MLELPKALGKSLGHLKVFFTGHEKTKESREEKNSLQKSKGMNIGGLRKKFEVDRESVNIQIKRLEKKIHALYLKIGQISAENQITSPSKLLANPEAEKILKSIDQYEKELQSLRNFLEKEESEVSPKNQLAEMVEQCSNEASKQALNDFLNKKNEEKIYVVSKLGQLNDKAITPVLKEALKIDNPRLQAELINILIKFEDEHLFAICNTFWNSPNSGVRASCCRGLYKSGGLKAIPQLTRGLRDSCADIRNSCAMYLGWLEENSALPSLIQLTLDVDQRVRRTAVASLAAIKDDAAVLPLIRMLGHSQGGLEEQRNILNAIEKIVGERLEFDESAFLENHKKYIDQLKTWWMERKHNIRPLKSYNLN